jgi:hypothetical protein
MVSPQFSGDSGIGYVHRPSLATTAIGISHA